MGQDRARVVPEMTPAVDPLVDPGSKTQPAEGGRDEAGDPPPQPGEVPGPAGTTVDGASPLGDEGVRDEVGGDDGRASR